MTLESYSHCNWSSSFVKWHSKCGAVSLVPGYVKFWTFTSAFLAIVVINRVSDLREVSAKKWNMAVKYWEIFLCG